MVYVRFRRWAEQGVWDALLETLGHLGLTDDWQHMIDSATVRGHSQAAGAKATVLAVKRLFAVWRSGADCVASGLTGGAIAFGLDPRRSVTVCTARG